MTFGDLMYKLGDAIQSTFAIMKSLNNSPNKFFITVMGILFIWWCWRMFRYDKESAQTGTMR